MARSELEMMADCDEQGPYTTKTRMIAALRRRTDNVEDIVKKIAMMIDDREMDMRTGGELLQMVREMHGTVTNGKKRGRGMWDAFWSGVGVFKAKGDKVMKE